MLNVNNIRDAATDAENRVTVAIRLGGAFRSGSLGTGKAAHWTRCCRCW
ncbi:MAG: hypothetical protein IJP55_03145 [Bacteroidales bacterium]|nr:hypothetical protein [Bacteroidales bacterium]